MVDPLGFIQGGGGMQGPQEVRRPVAGGRSEGLDFRGELMKNIAEVNQLQMDAEAAIEDVVAGRRDDLDNVMNAKRKADLAFKALLQVRNKLMDAYDELKQLRV